MASHRPVVAIAVVSSVALFALGLAAGTLLSGRGTPAPASPDMGDMMGGGMGMGASPAQTMQPDDEAALGNATPAGATIDRTHNQLTFTTSMVRFTVLGSPDTGPDMRFRIAGLTDPTIAVPQGASVTVQFINADTDVSHGWLLSSVQPPYPAMAMMVTPLAFAGAFAQPASRATTTALASETVAFTAETAGRYVYLCPVMGHAQQGMHGALLVTAS